MIDALLAGKRGGAVRFGDVWRRTPVREWRQSRCGLVGLMVEALLGADRAGRVGLEVLCGAASFAEPCTLLPRLLVPGSATKSCCGASLERF